MRGSPFTDGHVERKAAARAKVAHRRPGKRGDAVVQKRSTVGRGRAASTTTCSAVASRARGRRTPWCVYVVPSTASTDCA
jgi:hypothetical protein